MAKQRASIDLDPELVRLFRRACTKVGRDADDVFSQMLDDFLSTRHIEATVRADAPVKPPPGPVEDPSQPHAHPFCHNAHLQAREHRMSKRRERIAERIGEGRVAGTRERHPQRDVPLVSATPPSDEPAVLERVKLARERRQQIRDQIQAERSARHTSLDARSAPDEA